MSGSESSAWGTARDCVWISWDEPWPEVFWEPDPPLYLFDSEWMQLERRRRDWIEGLERDAIERQEEMMIAKHGPDALRENRD